MLRAARNTLLGETWIESGEAPEWQRLADRREAFPAQIPAGGLFLTAGADVQKDRIEVDVWAWGRGWKAGSSITSSSRAGRTIRPAGTS
jgi:phage terminase large subunit GpA-like protein